MTQATDAAIIHAVRSGERERFDDLVQRHIATVYAIACARLRNTADAEDAVQETFLSAFRKLHALRDPDRFEAWVAQIARNTAKQQAKSRSREEKKREALPQPIPATGDIASRDEMQRVLESAIGRLKPDHREAVLLHYFAGKSTSEIADTLSVSQSAIKKRLQRAREALGEDLVTQLSDSERRDMRLTPLIIATSSAIATAGGRSAATTGVSLGWSALAGGMALLAVAIGYTAIKIANQNEPPPPQSMTAAATAEQQPEQEEMPIESTDAESVLLPIPPAVQSPVNTTVDAPALPEPSEQLLETLDRKVSIVFSSIALENMVSFLSSTYKVPIYLDARVIADTNHSEPHLWFAEDEAPTNPAPPNEYTTDGMFDSVDIRDVPLSDLLVELLQPAGLDYVAEPGFVWVSTPERIRKEVGKFDASRFDDYDILEKLQENASVVYSNIHLKEIVAFMEDTYDINVVLDHRVINMADDSAGNSAEPDGTPETPGTFTTAVTAGMVPYVNVRDVELRDALRALVRPMNLDWVATGQDILISTYERIEAVDLPVPSLAVEAAPDR